MPAPRPSLCITCGHDAGTGAAINRLDDGRACPTCADRLLDLLPPPFPGFGHMVEARDSAGAREDSEPPTPGVKTLPPHKSRRGRKRGPRPE